MEVADENDPGVDSPVRKRKGDDEDVPVQEKRSHLGTFRERTITGVARTVAEVSGRVAAIELENFMCHENLKVTFDVTENNCFYIGGPNGSGKSALFAGMNIGLGGRGNHNDRGNSVKGYIKEGQTRAKIRITLTNRGEGSDPRYGNLIVIERSITQTSSTYSLRAIQGTGANRRQVPISTKKADIDHLLARFGIELNNPIYWMSQDRSRYFLQKMEPKKLYEIFMKATELESTQESYLMCEQMQKSITDSLNDLRVVLKEQKAEIDKWRDDKNKAKQEIENVKQLVRLNWYSHWAPVRDVEEKLAHWERMKEEHDRQTRKIEQDQRNIDLEAADYKRQMAEVQEKMADHLDAVKQYNEEENKMKKDVKAERSTQIEKEEAIHKLDKDARSIEQQIETAKRKIDDAVHRSQNNSDFKEMQQCRQREEELVETEEKMIDKRRRCDADAERMKAEKIEADQECRKLSAVYQDYSYKLRMMKQEVEQWEKIEKDQMTRFGPDISRILRLLKEHEHRFEHKPKGPIGMYLNVKEKKWCLAIEEALRHQLTSFIFNSRRDELMFAKLLQHNRIQQPNTSITKFGKQIYDVSRNVPAPGWNTILNSLDITDIDVMNFLIDVAQIENYLLFDSDAEARDIMNGNCPVPCNRGQTITGAQVFGSSAQLKSQYRFYSGRGRAAMMLSSRNGPIDKQAIAGEMENLGRQIETSKNKLVKAKTELGQLNMQLEKVQEEKYKAESTLQQTRSHITSVRIRMDKIKARDDEDTVIGNLRDAIDDNEGRLKKIAEERIEAVKVYNKQKAVLTEKETNLKDLQQEMKEYHLEQQQTQDAMEGLKLKIDKFASDKEKSERRDRDLQAVKEAHEKKKWLLIDEKKEKDKNAEAYEGEIPEGENKKPDFSLIPTTERLLDLCRKKTNEVRALQGRMTQLPTLEQMTVKKDNFTKAKKLFVDLTRICRHLDECMKIRTDRYPIIRHAITMRLKFAFSNLIRFRFAGSLNVDYDKKTIHLDVNPHSKHIGGGLKDLKGLSGGERSYTTACFVMALWDIMEAPFRCMDEFDVFMDAINRKIVMDLLVKLATERYPHHQFLFFTPQGINELGEKDRVQIFEMPKVRP